MGLFWIHASRLQANICLFNINKDIDVNKSEIVTTLLKITIFERSPRVAGNLLLGLPFDTFRALWQRYIHCPIQSIIEFEFALTSFKHNTEELFGSFISGYRELACFPAELRNPIIDAGSNLNLLEVVYDGIKRIVEPYSLVYKIRRDGYGQEYFYVHDRTGGRSSGPGIKAFVNTKIDSIEVTSENFTPRYEVELSKAGEYGDKTYFESPRRRTFSAHSFSENKYTIECSYCGKRFRRSTYNTRLNKHKDRYGNRCYGRVGFIV